MICLIAFVNGKGLQFEIDSYEYEDGVYKFFVNGEIVAEFVKNNIAGFFISGYVNE